MIAVVKRRHEKQKIYEKNFEVTPRKFHFGTKFLKRDERQKSISKDFDEKVSSFLLNYDPLEQKSPRSGDFKEFIKFRMKFFEEGADNIFGLLL